MTVTYRVVFAPEAEDQLAKLYRYIASASSTQIADRFTEAIVQFCESLSTFPRRGNKRDDVRPGLRVTHYSKRVIIAFVVDADLIASVPRPHRRCRPSSMPCDRLAMAKVSGKRCRIIARHWPVAGRPDVSLFSATHAEIRAVILRTDEAFIALRRSRPASMRCRRDAHPAGAHGPASREPRPVPGRRRQRQLAS